MYSYAVALIGAGTRVSSKANGGKQSKANARLPGLGEGRRNELQEVALVLRGDVPLTHPLLDVCAVKAEELEFVLVAGKLEKSLVYY